MDFFGKILDYRYRDRIAQVREEFSEKVKQLLDNDLMYQHDFDKTMTNDFWVEKHLEWHRGNISKTVDGLIYAVKIIKKYRLREINLNDFIVEPFASGAFFEYLPDIHGRKTFYIRTKYSVNLKEVREVSRQFSLYLTLKMEEEAGEKGYVIVNDLAGASMANFDPKMAIVNRDMTDIFPPFHTLLVMVNVPFLLRGIAKTLFVFIPSEMRKGFLILTEEQLQQVIPSENLPDILGGTCKRPYKGSEVVPKGCLTIKEQFERLTVDENGNFIHDFKDGKRINPVFMFPTMNKETADRMTKVYENVFTE